MSVEPEANFQFLAENSTDVICRAGEDSVLHYVSPSSFRILGWNIDNRSAPCVYMISGDIMNAGVRAGVRMVWVLARARRIACIFENFTACGINLQPTSRCRRAKRNVSIEATFSLSRRSTKPGFSSARTLISSFVSVAREAGELDGSGADLSWWTAFEYFLLETRRAW